MLHNNFSILESIGSQPYLGLTNYQRLAKVNTSHTKSAIRKTKGGGGRAEPLFHILSFTELFLSHVISCRPNTNWVEQ